MKRDLDLVREILKQLEASASSSSYKMPVIDGFTETEIGYHAYIMEQAGLIETWGHRPISKPAEYSTPKSLTWTGHEFLDASKNDSIWAKAKSHVIAPAGGVALSVLLEWLKAEAKGRLGLPP